MQEEETEQYHLTDRKAYLNMALTGVLSTTKSVRKDSNRLQVIPRTVCCKQEIQKYKTKHT